MNMKNTRMIRSGRIIYINYLSAWYYGYWGWQEGFGRTFMENAMAWLCPITGVDDGSIHFEDRDFSLNQNYPNPFNPSTHLCFSLSEPGHAELSIFNIKGQFVRSLADGFFTRGLHPFIWNGRDEHGNPCPSGVYLSVLAADDFYGMRRMILMR